MEARGGGTRPEGIRVKRKATGGGMTKKALAGDSNGWYRFLSCLL